MVKNNKVNWEIEDTLAGILNEIDIDPEKKVLLSTGERCIIYDDGQIYTASSRKLGYEKMITKNEFAEQTGDFMINYKYNRKKK